MTTEARKRLHDIRMAAETLKRFTIGKSIEEFRSHELLQAGVERKLEIIGEAFAQLREEDTALAGQFSNLRQIIGMRNRLVHGYDRLDLDVVWDTVANHVPKLLQEVEAMLK